MATYVNDLRLKEIATGDESGTWGTSTNTNLELIGEALGYGTEAITTNADTHTTTVADGATDPGRAMYIEYTGTLDSTCTITIAPNTLNRVHIIENGTSGSQSIIIKQGSGATVTIPTGATKMVYLDGAGSGAKVTDALASLNLETSKVIETTASIQTPLIEFTDGDDAITIADGGGTTFAQTATFSGDIDLAGSIDVDGTSNLDIVDIDGAVDMASTLVVAGKITADAGIDIDNFNIDGTTIALSSGDITLDSAGRVDLSADDNGEVRLFDGSLHYGQFKEDSNHFLIQSIVADADIYIQGLDDSTIVNAVQFDMSDAGRAIFPAGVTVHDATALTNTTFDARDIDNVTSLNVQNNAATIQRSQSATAAPTLVFNKARGSLGSEANVNNGDFTGSIVFRGYHTNGFYQTATIESKVSGTHGTSDMPGTLLFATSNDGNATPTSRMEIDQAGVTKLTGGVQSGRQDLKFNNGSISLATGATYTLTDVLNTGALISIGQNRSNSGITYDHCLIFAETGTAATVVANPSGRFAINSATTSNSTNIFVNSGSIVILNEVGTTVTYSIAAFVFQGN